MVSVSGSTENETSLTSGLSANAAWTMPMCLLMVGQMPAQEVKM